MRPHMAVFFTRGMSLEGWHRAGILERELALYRELVPDLSGLTFVTYGGVNDAAWANGLSSLEVLSNRWSLPTNLYSVLAPMLHWRRLRRASVFRTNQINGAWCGVVAKLLFRKALVVRCGFLWADFVTGLGASRWRHAITRGIERLIMRAADFIVVAAPADASSIVCRYGIDASRVTVIPNYVDTRRFRPLAEVRVEAGRLAFVGRLEAQKNLESLIDALGTLPGVALTVIGDGSLRPNLEARARALDVRVDFIGPLPHSALPHALNRSEVFVLPSHYEGTPKALLEAMACGVPVIGANTPGIREILVHRENGFVCGTSPTEIHAALVEVLNDADLRQRMRDGGLRYVHERCSLQIAVERERALLASIA